MAEPKNSCKYNSMIECAGLVRPCGKCGWNPEVYEKRLQKIREPKPKQKGLLICPT